MKTKHTPGPWTLVKRHSSFICSVVHEAGPEFISVVDECTEANAQLIAAAPEMLEALEMLSKITIDGDRNIGNFECLIEALRLGVNALNKVKGEL